MEKELSERGFTELYPGRWGLKDNHGLALVVDAGPADGEAYFEMAANQIIGLERVLVDTIIPPMRFPLRSVADLDYLLSSVPGLGDS